MDHLNSRHQSLFTLVAKQYMSMAAQLKEDGVRLDQVLTKCSNVGIEVNLREEITPVYNNTRGEHMLQPQTWRVSVSWNKGSFEIRANTLDEVIQWVWGKYEYICGRRGKRYHRIARALYTYMGQSIGNSLSRTEEIISRWNNRDIGKPDWEGQAAYFGKLLGLAFKMRHNKDKV